MDNFNVWYEFRELINKNKSLIYISIFVTVLSFGFSFSNFSIGIDDPAYYYYLHSNNCGNMIQQGRLCHVLLNKLSGAGDFIPFFNEFLAAALYGLSGLLFCTLFQMVSKEKLTSFQLISFSVIYISYSLITQKFIYSLDVLVTMLSYCACAVSLAYSFAFVKTGRFKAFGFAVLYEMIATGSYESFIMLYFCGVFAVFLVELIINKEHISFKNYLLEGLKYAAVLLVSILAYYSLVILLQLLSHQFGLFGRDNLLSMINSLGFIPALKQSLRSLGHCMLQLKYLPVKEFVIISALGFAVFVFYSFRLKSLLIILSWLFLSAGNFLIPIFAGETLYRVCQTFCLFVSFNIFIFVYLLTKNRKTPEILVFAVSLLVFMQAADMNRHFYNDYVRSQKEQFLINSVASDIVRNCDVRKPVVFTKNGSLAYLNTNLYPEIEAGSPSAVNWGFNAFGDPTTPLLDELFRMYGYDFIITPSCNQACEGKEISINMPVWPHEGYINELPEFIVVNIG